MADPSLHDCGERLKSLERDVAALDRLIDVRFAGLDRALQLQAEKDAKHFDDLNHEAHRIAAAYEKYLPRETYIADRANKTTILLSVAALLISLATLIVLIMRVMK